MTLTPGQDAYLREHQLAVLATGRRDGSPQLSTIMYDYDGNDVAISVTSDSAKWVNALRQPRVALLVNDGLQQLILYGAAEGVSAGPERLELTKRIRRRAMGREPSEDDATLAAQLDETKRVILRVTPDKVLMYE